MVSTISNEEELVEPVIGLRALAAAIWQKRRIWLITGLVGLLIGASLHLVIPKKYTAETDLYLTVPSGSNAVDVMAGNVSLRHPGGGREGHCRRSPPHDAALTAFSLQRPRGE